METQKLTDLSYLREMAEGDVASIKEMIAIYFDQVPEYERDMHAYLETGDWTALAKVAHKAKSTAAIVGMTSLQQELDDFEHLARQGVGADTYAEKVEYFIRLLRQGEAELREVLPTL